MRRMPEALRSYRVEKLRRSIEGEPPLPPEAEALARAGRSWKEAVDDAAE